MERKILNWFGTGEVGASSRAMALAALGLPNDKSHPCDPSDFNRCLLLLKAVPEICNHMDRVAAISTIWANLVAKWSEVEQCFLAEAGFDWSKCNRAPMTYKLMKKVGC